MTLFYRVNEVLIFFGGGSRERSPKDNDCYRGDNVFFSVKVPVRFVYPLSFLLTKADHHEAPGLLIAHIRNKMGFDNHKKVFYRL